MMKWKVAFAAMIAVVALGAAVFSTSGRSADAGVTNAVSVDCGACTFASGTTPILVDIEFTNNSGASIQLGAMNFNLLGDNQSSLNPTAGACAAPGTACNPNLILADASWSCGPPNPVADQDASATATNSFISCFNGGGTGETVANGATITLAQVTFTGGTDGVTNLTLSTVNVADALGVEVHACAPGGDICNNATVQIGASAATSTATAIATSTNTPVPTNTPCQTGCATSTSLAFITVTPTASATVPLSATVPAAADTPVPGATQPGGSTGGGGGGGGSGPITLPDTGTGTGSGGTSIAWALAAVGLAALLGGGLGLNLAGAAVRREGK